MSNYLNNDACRKTFNDKKLTQFSLQLNYRESMNALFIVYIRFILS